MTSKLLRCSYGQDITLDDGVRDKTSHLIRPGLLRAMCVE